MSTDNETRVVGWKLARRVAKSDLYDQLTDIEAAECDELIARGNGSEGPPDRQSPPGISCRLARCQWQADCSRIQYCQGVIFETGRYRKFIQSDVVATLKRLLEQPTAEADMERLRADLGALMQRAARTV